MAENARVYQLLNLLILPLLVHGGVPGQEHVSPSLDARPELSVQHMVIGVVHGHVGGAEHPLIARLAGGQVAGAPEQQVNGDKQRHQNSRYGGADEKLSPNIVYGGSPPSKGTICVLRISYHCLFLLSICRPLAWRFQKF